MATATARRDLQNISAVCAIMISLEYRDVSYINTSLVDASNPSIASCQPLFVCNEKIVPPYRHAHSHRSFTVRLVFGFHVCNCRHVLQPGCVNTTEADIKKTCRSTKQTAASNKVHS